MTHHEIIRKLGGPIALARDLGLSRPEAALHWPRRGIPARLWHRVVELAEQKEEPVTFAALEDGRPSSRQEAAA